MVVFHKKLRVQQQYRAKACLGTKFLKLGDLARFRSTLRETWKRGFRVLNQTKRDGAESAHNGIARSLNDSEHTGLTTGHVQLSINRDSKLPTRSVAIAQTIL